MRPTTNTSHTVRGLLAALVAASLLAAGCGSDDDGEPAGRTGSESSAPASPAATVKVTETDFAIEPKDARVDKAGQIRFEVVNRGKAPHALEIETPDREFETTTLNAGDSAVLEAELEEGKYTWYCPVGDHRDRGMEGTVTVGSGGGGSGDSGSSGGAGGGY